jgi:hypothetical protein
LILPIPTEIVVEVGIEPGDEFMVEAMNGTLAFWPFEPQPTEFDSPRGFIVGEGSQRYFQLYRGMAMPAGPDPVPREPLDDWDF